MRSVPPAQPILTPISPWLTGILYPLATHCVLPAFFRRIEVVGQDYLPRSGPVILAPTHRSRWDALIVPYVAGRPVTGRDLRFMVSHDEMLGLQGWVIRNFGGFPIDTLQPAIATLRYGIEVLKAGEALVIFPEGNIFRTPTVQPLKPGLARIAIQAAQARSMPDVQIVPLGIQYSVPVPDWGSSVAVRIGPPLSLANYDLKRSKQAATKLTLDLQTALNQLSGQNLTPRTPLMVSGG
uniref:Phospholipid/glycerol acyltransferase n=1 Tax=Cyanothece sp. (strain PCC 7425 / ATCC 29141) TaxID=395961 RepID=B8HU27_CYAP4